jgi:hypothetical protein
MAPALLVLSAIGSAVEPFKQSYHDHQHTHSKFVFARPSMPQRQINREAKTNGLYDGSLRESGAYTL